MATAGVESFVVVVVVVVVVVAGSGSGSGSGSGVGTVKSRLEIKCSGPAGPAAVTVFAGPAVVRIGR